MTRLAACLLIAAALGGCSAVPFPPRTYINPVFDRDFADPAVVSAEGAFYAYATQTTWDGRLVNVQVARSVDLVRWEHLGDALPEKPAWARSKQNIWAPHVLHDAALRTYFMYYSAEPDHSTGKCLAVATSAKPEGPFVDSGAPMLCGQGFEHIDPMAFDDPQTGERLLYWGSGFQPIRVQPLAPDRLRFLPGSTARDIAFPDPTKPYRSLIEGPWVTYRSGTYYLFYSGDRCCLPQPRYAIMVARSASALGPFDLQDTVMVAENDAWHAPGHSAVVTDEAGTEWIVYHAIDPAQPVLDDLVHGGVSRRVLLIDRLFYGGGWPRVIGDGPSRSAHGAPLLGQ